MSLARARVLQRDILCQECCVDRHKCLPLHVINISTKWNGQYFERTSLKDIGLRVQLGHSDMTCACPVRGHTDFLVLHVNGIHRVNPQTACTRQVLEHFLLLTWSSKVSAFEYYQTLERLTDNTGISVPKSRYSAFMRMIREYRHILLLKRAGLQPGDLALHCPACPQPGINLPRGWETVDASLKFLYYLIIAMDANFCLKNRTQSSDSVDPGMHTGLAYFVANKPYSAHVLKFASQKDISTCSGFSTLAHAESKFSNGLRATGVRLCLCARHEFVRPKGVAIIPLLLLNVVISYNVACQWKINLFERMDWLPENMRIPVAFATTAFRFAIPKFHASAHEDSCAILHSLNLMPGVGRTDGEGIERNWVEINRVANSTKEIGPGAQHDTLDDHFGHHNWRKFVGLGLSLQKKLITAVKECDRQQAAFQEFNLAVGTSYENEWTAMVENWEVDKTQENPFINRERENLLEQNDSGSFVEAENTILWLPSSIDTSIWTSTCRDNIICIEEELRNTQCHDCLNKLRNVLRARVHLIKHRNRNTRGQRANTRAASVISRLDAKIKIIAKKYHTAHRCLIALRGPV
ncbi:uncharacterized protein F5147DRAFT_748044 [Suillus discolor]|uniref:CxC2-like cysteine cluster KDZ transposase-associated domain-containing protein n=1 Tax=Suillus discolor TaxID=1912936 RepID=A0A9P7JMZ2_9AGAM|nr:uncharacterized protein F5147DRAFT_748044 [Suillus discolor]KAG2092145.1 hypothetical protein F5147DRAFT_748044 [Suillus discolor]